MKYNKYYTPTLEEFHIGFEYETYNMSCGGYVIMDFSDGKYTFETVKEPTDHMWFKDKFRLPKMPIDTVSDLKEIDSRIKENRIRVKYLDKEDLEDIGFIIEEEEIKPYGHYLKGKFKNNTELWYAKRQDNEKIYVSLKSKRYNGNIRVRIKNKSDLVKIMKQSEML
jgi:hypothetical protein